MYDFSPLCIFKCFLKSPASEDASSHIGCICLIFLHCAFSDVSSNRLPEKMHSHIGCICLTFLHCAFLNASSKHQLKKMQSHIGCNCAWHCELCAALCAHNYRKRLWSDHRGYITIENMDELTHKGRYRAARQLTKQENNNNNNKTITTKQ